MLRFREGEVMILCGITITILGGLLMICKDLGNVGEKWKLLQCLRLVWSLLDLLVLCVIWIVRKL